MAADDGEADTVGHGADDTITASYAEPPGPHRFWEPDGIEVTGAGVPMAQYLTGGRNGQVIAW